jgi:hypothetical protein
MMVSSGGRRLYRRAERAAARPAADQGIHRGDRRRPDCLFLLARSVDRLLGRSGTGRALRRPLCENDRSRPTAVIVGTAISADV